MTSSADVLVEAGRLAARGEPFVLATVMRVVRPASTRRGDRALVTSEGTLHGWVGGDCSEHIVVREALAALAAGEPRLVRICPPGGDSDAPDDVVVAESHCASEGTVEVLIEPCLPAPLLAVVGDSPAARTLTQLARDIGWRLSDEVVPEVDAVVVASMGRGDEAALAAALATRAHYVGLVASAQRARSVLVAMRQEGIGEESLARVHSPAGLDLGASTQEEIAVAILAQLVAWRHTRAPSESVRSHAEEGADAS
jgi:xanthine dehydrogenase accessory factor